MGGVEREALAEERGGEASNFHSHRDSPVVDSLVAAWRRERCFNHEQEQGTGSVRTEQQTVAPPHPLHRVVSLVLATKPPFTQHHPLSSPLSNRCVRTGTQGRRDARTRLGVLTATARRRSLLSSPATCRRAPALHRSCNRPASNARSRKVPTLSRVAQHLSSLRRDSTTSRATGMSTGILRACIGRAARQPIKGGAGYRALSQSARRGSAGVDGTTQQTGLDRWLALSSEWRFAWGSRGTWELTVVHRQAVLERTRNSRLPLSPARCGRLLLAWSIADDSCMGAEHATAAKDEEAR